MESSRFKAPFSCRDIWDQTVAHDLRMKALDWRNREDVRYNMIDDHLIGLEEHRSWLESLKNPLSPTKVRIFFAGDAPIGVMSLEKIDEKNMTCQFGVCIGEESYRKKGYGYRAVLEIQSWAFKEMGFRRLYTAVLGDNFRALSSYIRAGFIVEGVFKGHLLRDQKPVDLYWIGMLRREWIS